MSIRISRSWLSALLLVLTAVAKAASIPGLILPLYDVEAGTAATGIVSEVLVKEGDTVQQGQPLVRLNDEVEKLELERSAKILEKARFDHEAAEKLLADKIGTREDALKKRIEHDLAVLQQKAAQLRLDQRTIRSPIQGIVVKRDKEPGEAVLLHETVAQIVHIRQVNAQFFLEPAQAQMLQPGQMMRFSVPLMGKPGQIVGKLDFIDPRMDAESGLYRIKLLVDNVKLHLKAGMRVEIELP
jgi:membrane fusion protein, multidrug efflux system